MIATILFAASGVAYITDLYGAEGRLLGWGLAAAGALAEAVAVTSAAVSGQLAPQSASFAIQALTWLLVTNFLIADAFLGLRAAGAFLMTVVTVASAVLLALPAGPGPGAVGPLGSAHLFAALFGYGAFALAFAASGLYLVQERALRRRAFDGPYRRVPPLLWLDRTAHGLILYGFPMLCLVLLTDIRRGPAAVLGTGAVCVLTGTYLWGRARRGLRGREAARLAVWGFTGALANVLLLSLLLNSV